MKTMIFALGLALMTLFVTVGANAYPTCGKVYVRGHYGSHHTWVPAHYRHRHWVPAHRGPHGRMIPGRCD